MIDSPFAALSDYISLNASMNSSLVIPACLRIIKSVDPLILSWFGKVRGVLLPSGLIRLIEI